MPSMLVFSFLKRKIPARSAVFSGRGPLFSYSYRISLWISSSLT